MNNPYFPIPFSNDLVQGAADTGFPQLIPRFTLADGAQLTPTSFIRHIRCEAEGAAIRLSYAQDVLNRLGSIAPIRDERISVETCYTFDHGSITRHDIFMSRVTLDAVSIDMEFASFSEEGVLENAAGKAVLRFARGEAHEFEVTGFDDYALDSVADDPLYRAPMGKMPSRLRCHYAGDLQAGQSLSLSWTLRYRNSR